VADKPIDEAYVEIKPDLDHFDRDVKRELDQSFNRIERQLDKLTDTIEKQFDRLIATLEKNFVEIEITADEAFDSIKDSAGNAADAIARDITVGTKIAKHEIDDMADDAEHDFHRMNRASRDSGFSISKVFRGVGTSVSNIFSSITETVSNVGSKISSVLGNTIGQVGSSISTVTSGIGSVFSFALYGVGIPLIIGLAGALSQLVGILAALPAAAGVAVAAIAPLVLAFHGFTDAIGAVLEGDPDKINEALKKLSPSAAKVVKEFQGLIKPFSQLQKLTQEALFKPLVGVLSDIAYQLLPTLQKGLPLVAGAFGKMFEFMSKAFSNGEFAGVLANTFATTARIIENLTPELGRFAELFISLWNIGLPYVERFFSVLTKGLAVFNDWLEKSIDGDKVVGWLDRAWHVGSQLFEIIKQLAIYAGTLLGSFADEGTDTLDGIAEALKKINAYFKSSDGAETLHNFGVIVHWAGDAFVFFLEQSNNAYHALNAFFNFMRNTKTFFGDVAHWVVDAWNTAVDWTKNAWQSIKDWVVNTWNSITDWFKSTGSGIGNWFRDTWNSMYESVRNFITNTIAAVQAFPGVLKQWIIDSLHATFYEIGYIIGLMVKFFITDLPNAVIAGFEWAKTTFFASIAAIVNFVTVTIPKLASDVWNWFVGLWNNVTNATMDGVHRVQGVVSELPGRIWSYVQDMQRRVESIFSSLWHNAVNFVKNLVTDAVSEAGKLPDRVWNAMKNVGDLMYNVGQDIVRGMVNGIKSLQGWLVDTAKSLAHDAWEGAKKAIGANSPSKEFAKLGKWSVQGFAQGFDQFDLTGNIASSVKAPLTSLGRSTSPIAPATAPTVNVGGAQVIAYLQIGDDQLHPVVVRTMYDNPQDVALAAQQGDTELSRRR
jgi:phage-related protein